MKFRSRYGKYRLVLVTDSIGMTSDGKSVFLSGNKKGIPGTVCFSDYEYIPKNKDVYDAIKEAWDSQYGHYTDDVLSIHDSAVEIPKGMSKEATDIFLEGLQRRQAEGKVLPNPGIDFWEVDPAITNMANPVPREKPDVFQGTRTSTSRG